MPVALFRLLGGLCTAVVASGTLWGADASDDIKAPEALTEQPVATRRVAPDYPFVLRRAGTTGTALIEFVVTKSGEVADAWIVRATEPEFGTAALRAMKQWRYTPGKINGQPVNTLLRQALSFSLTGDDPPEEPAVRLVSRDTFVSMLPAKLHVDPTMSGAEPGDFSRCIKALEMLGPTKTSFVKLPKGAKALHAKQRVPPTYPQPLLKSNVEGAASFLVYVDEQGEVKAVYTLASTHPAFAESGGAALSQWKFAPAEVGGTKVPVIFERLLTFKVR